MDNLLDLFLRRLYSTVMRLEDKYKRTKYLMFSVDDVRIDELYWEIDHKL